MEHTLLVQCLEDVSVHVVVVCWTAHDHLPYETTCRVWKVGHCLICPPSFSSLSQPNLLNLTCQMVCFTEPSGKPSVETVGKRPDSLKKMLGRWLDESSVCHLLSQPNVNQSAQWTMWLSRRAKLLLTTSTCSYQQLLTGCWLVHNSCHMDTGV